MGYNSQDRHPSFEKFYYYNYHSIFWETIQTLYYLCMNMIYYVILLPAGDDFILFQRQYRHSAGTVQTQY